MKSSDRFLRGMAGVLLCEMFNKAKLPTQGLWSREVRETGPTERPFVFPFEEALALRLFLLIGDLFTDLSNLKLKKFRVCLSGAHGC